MNYKKLQSFPMFFIRLKNFYSHWAEEKKEMCVCVYECVCVCVCVCVRVCVCMCVCVCE